MSNYTHNPIEVIAEAFFQAKNNKEILPDIEWQSMDAIKTRRPMQQEMAVYNFLQQWGSTALGFGGIGGQAFSMAYTTVIVCGENAAVFFNGAHAYTVPLSQEFEDDMRRFDVASRKDSVKYRKS